MTDTVTAKLAEWEALVEGATAGPWDNYRPNEAYRIYEVCATTTQGLNETLAEVSGYNAGPDAAFIATAPDIATALLGFVREVTEGHEPDAEGRYCGECASNAHGNALVPWPCPTEQAARKWIGGEG